MMVFLKLTSLLSVLTACLLLQIPAGRVFAVPTPSPFDGLDHEAREILARATPAAPHWVVYNDAWISSGLPPTSDVDVSFM